MKKLLSALLASALMVGVLAGCGGEPSGSGAPSSNSPAASGSNTPAQAGSDLKGDLVFAIWDNNLLEYIESNDMEGKFQETYPNINVEVEKIKDDSEYWNSMKMRASANQLPDVMFNKPFTLSRFQDYLLDLSDTEACKNNTLAQGYALNGGEMVMYDGGGDDFTALQNETTFDYKKLGAQMLTDGFDLDAALSALDAKWAAARTKLGIQ